MINTNLITCSLCRNFYADPRQIPCSHSFCFDCISGCFNDQNYVLVCPKCDKLHLYNSRNEFEQRCMRDGFLASMVAQYKRSQSRASAISSGNFSRPSSAYSFIPIQPARSERSTPSINVIAKCQLCNIRSELTVCSHCDNVICMKCIDEHQNTIKIEWETCRNKFESIYQRSSIEFKEKNLNSYEYDA